MEQQTEAFKLVRDNSDPSGRAEAVEMANVPGGSTGVLFQEALQNSTTSMADEGLIADNELTTTREMISGLEELRTHVLRDLRLHHNTKSSKKTGEQKKEGKQSAVDARRFLVVPFPLRTSPM